MLVLTSVLVTLLHNVQAAGQLSLGITGLAMDIAADIERSSSKNFVMSPYSAHSAFSQLLLGSGGATEAELQKVLGVSGQDVSKYGEVRKGLQSGQSQLKVANLLALAEGFKPLPEYNSQLLSTFQSSIRELDFVKNKKDAAAQINSFVKEATKGNIDTVVEEDGLDSLTKLIVINAIYFKAPWKTTFDRAETFDADFSTPGGTVRTQYMTGKMQLRMLTDSINKVDVVELPYSDSSKSLLLLVSTDGDSSHLISKARKLKLSAIREIAPADIVVTLPPFRVRTRTDLKDTMRSLGASAMFSEGADFSKLSAQPLYVTDAIQDAKIEVTEEGTEAAAATSVTIGLRSSQRTRQFFADRPFLFILYDFAEDLPLFVGKVNNPTETGGLAGPQPLIPRFAINSNSAINLAGPNDASATGSTCGKYLNDYANAFENKKLCEVAEAKKLFDWLRSFRTVCEQSSDLYSNFVANNCGAEWCAKARVEHKAWVTEKEKLCATDELKAAHKLACKNVANHLDAATKLKCDLTF